MTGAASEVCLTPGHGDHHSVADIVNLNRLDRVVLVTANPVLKEATDRSHALEVHT